MLPPIPPRSVVVATNGVTVVVRPAGCATVILFAAIFNLTFLPGSLPGAPPFIYGLVAGLTLPMIGMTVLTHEFGHAIAFRLQGASQVCITLRAGGVLALPL